MNIICLKYGSKYDSKYVNVLYNMITRNTTKSFKFVCFTDDPFGIAPHIDTMPLPDNTLDGWWNKLAFFKYTFGGLSGKTLYLDLDIIITSNIDVLFVLPSGFYIIDDWLPHSPVFNSSVMIFDIGSQPQIWDKFVRDRHTILRLYHGDQEWITKSVKSPMIFPKEWIVSFKWNKCWDIPNAMIVVFHGRPNPPEAINGYGGFPKAEWIRDVWR